MHIASIYSSYVSVSGVACLTKRSSVAWVYTEFSFDVIRPGIDTCLNVII
jgi:hypothetical protein